MTATPGGADGRLDSWKAIAEYLGRDVATVRRWEKSAGLPVRRVAGGPGRSVYAYVSEIDQWLRRNESPNAPAADPDPVTVAAPEAPDARRWNWKVAVATIVTGLAAVAWHGRGPTADAGELAVEVTPAAVIARDTAGAERWRYQFPADERVLLTPRSDGRSILIDRGAGGVIAGTGYSTSAANATTHVGGRLLWLSSTGQLQRTFSFDDTLSFTDETYGGPWVITDYRLSDESATRRLAAAAHHMQWWPSVVTVLNDRWQREGTFVHAGWVEHLQWISPGRLLIVGFSNALDGGMVALLDPATMTGQSPRARNATYACAACGPESALRYVILPRSELNRVTASPFNRAILEAAGDRLVVSTVEVPRATEPASAMYEFSPSLGVLSASYGDRYWEMHRSLEAQGRLDHPRERCPDRDGPPHVEIWEPASGWKTLRLRK